MLLQQSRRWTQCESEPGVTTRLARDQAGIHIWVQKAVDHIRARMLLPAYYVWYVLWCWIMLGA